MNLMRAMTPRVLLAWACLAGTGCDQVPPDGVANDADQRRATLAALVAGEQRTPAYRDRDRYRHPVETLMFFGLRPEMTVVEIWPTAGWYTEIIAPFLKGEGQYYGAHFDAEHRSDFLRDQRAGFAGKLESAPDIYGSAQVTELGRGKYGIAPPGSADMVLTFRNVHNWTIGEYAEEVFAAMFTALKPGGVLGVVEHRGEPYLPGREAPTGYVRESDVVALATAAGFVLEESSEVNANPADTKDYPEGVWTLPPSLRRGPVDYEKYTAIGESDRSLYAAAMGCGCPVCPGGGAGRHGRRDPLGPGGDPRRRPSS